MRLNFKRLGDYIQPVEGRNSDLSNIPLMGLSIQKKFIPSIANTVGTNMTTYRIIKRNQFGYGPVTSRNGEKITIALFDDYDEAMISQAYIPFEVSDTEKLLPQYLMMWFRRPEFDRYARFKSHGSAREIFSWDEMQEVMLPIPDIDKQREIVKEYNTIQNRIQLNEQLIQKLEETAQAIYREWFVEFEFPDKYGKPYKSNGGEMVWNEELEKEIPKGWKLGTLEDLYKFQYGKGNTNPNNGGLYPIYGAGGVIGGFDEYNSEDAPVIGHMGEYCGKVVFAFGKHFVTYNGVMCLAKFENLKWFSYLTLLSKDLMSNTRGSSQPFVSYDMLYETEAILPNDEVALRFNGLAQNIFRQTKLSQSENQKLTELKALLLSKLATVE
ncbi:restriction endonuclease S subunit [Belliella baltica DSM 15883]|uniref:Restriction endonuclease S subunit n=1 Tax=Belliella baltica (strain DSM 15883 / CIP 108006 / LMG 21964 / BA134) TaxID=866536 RepID=I3Z640_BELBD|nr:restriction endonuclease subunit S [Belliella baltica]AFL84708.1 restriction endonuclease S subunit [Belliella baltica DSM 15883]